MLKGLGNLEDEILSSLFGVISSKREDMENKWKNTQKLKKIKTCVCLFSYVQVPVQSGVINSFRPYHCTKTKHQKLITS